MTNAFVSLPLDKLMNRQNIVSRLERVESQAGASPSARVGRLAEFSPDAGDITAGRFLVFDNDTGQLQVAIDEDGVSITIPTSYADINSVKWVDGETVNAELYSAKAGGTISASLRTARITGNDSNVTVISNAPVGNVSQISLEAQINDTLQHYVRVHSTNGVSISAITNDTGLAHGTWTPTGVAGTNVSASSDIIPGTCNYLRVGNQVFINGSVQIDTTAAGAFTCYLTIPIASDFNTNFDANGNGTHPGTGIPNIFNIREDQTNNRLQLDGYSQIATNVFYRFTAGYIIK